MERIDKIVTQEEYDEIQAEITRLEMEQALLGVDNSAKIKELTAKIS
jgi:hypothetical protein